LAPSLILATTLALCLGSCGFQPRPSPPPLSADTRDGRWHQDLQYFARELPRLHGNLFHTLARSELDSAVAKLQAEIPTLSDEEIAVGIGRIAALADDAHTHAWLGRRRLPIALYWFSDGVFVTAARSDFESTLRRRVVRIGETDVDEAVRRASALV